MAAERENDGGRAFARAPSLLAVGGKDEEIEQKLDLRPCVRRFNEQTRERAFARSLVRWVVAKRPTTEIEPIARSPSGWTTMGIDDLRLAVGDAGWVGDDLRLRQPSILVKPTENEPLCSFSVVGGVGGTRMNHNGFAIASGTSRVGANEPRWVRSHFADVADAASSSKKTERTNDGSFFRSRTSRHSDCSSKTTENEQ